MGATTPLLENVLTLARQLTLADQAKLVEQLAPTIDSIDTAQDKNTAASRFPPHSLAAHLAADPDSALSHMLGIARSGDEQPTDADVERWHDERLSERYGV